MKCKTKLLGSVSAWLLKVGGGTSFRPSKLRPCNNSVRERSRATSKLGCPPKDANTPPVFGFIRVTHITGNIPPKDASLIKTGNPLFSSSSIPAKILGYFARTSFGTSGRIISSSIIFRLTARSNISDRHCTFASYKLLPALMPLLTNIFSSKLDGK